MARKARGVYDEDLLQGLDFLLAEMARRDMKAVLVLNNFFQWSGGMAQYVSWATGTPIPYPATEQGGATWDDFQNYAARFFANYEAQRFFLDYIHTLVHRENTITGTRYRDDPTIMAWQLANEPRGFRYSDQYVAWVDQVAGFLQLIDPNHLVSLGGEGKLALEGNAVGGSNVWSWSGQGYPVEPGEPWQEGEPFTGDPPHEVQGWYAIYDTDTSTQEILSTYARLMDALGEEE